MKKTFIIAFLLFLLLFPAAYLNSVVTSLARKVQKLRELREKERRELLIRRARMVELSRITNLLKGENGVEN